MKKRYWLLAIGCWLAPAPAFAAPDSVAVDSLGRSGRLPDGPWWIGVWGAAATHSPFTTRHGERHRDLYMAGVRLGRQMHTSDRLVFDYYVDIVPFVRSTNNPVKYTDVETCAPVAGTRIITCATHETMETATARGFAVTPIGLQMRAFHGRAVEAVIGASFGAVKYDAPVPDPSEKRLNFMVEAVLGIHVRTGRDGAVIAGVRQNHTSNANTGSVNPGIDSRVLYFGVTRWVSRRSQR
ncbi:hypothetical protein BH23GEM1_BH23GEM1_06710 [soil metagenome]